MGTGYFGAEQSAVGPFTWQIAWRLQSVDSQIAKRHCDAKQTSLFRPGFPSAEGERLRDAPASKDSRECLFRDVNGGEVPRILTLLTEEGFRLQVAPRWGFSSDRSGLPVGAGQRSSHAR